MWDLEKFWCVTYLNIYSKGVDSLTPSAQDFVVQKNCPERSRSYGKSQGQGQFCPKHP